jgi:hypothetical protein
LPEEALPPRVQPPELPADAAAAGRRLWRKQQQPQRRQQQVQQQPSTPDLSWMQDRLAAAMGDPADFGTMTPPRLIPSSGAAAGATSSSPSPCGGLSAAEVLALGAPGCFTLVGLESRPLLEAAWRMMLNLRMEEVRGW